LLLLGVCVPAVLVTLMCLWLWSPTPEPNPATAAALEAAAEKWWRPGISDYREIPKTDWPPELRRLGPRKVLVTPKGVYIPFGSRFVEEWGLFVLPEGSDFRPQESGDPSFRLLRGRVYRYYVVG
jgi:hypothetical protein